MYLSSDSLSAVAFWFRFFTALMVMGLLARQSFRVITAISFIHLTFRVPYGPSCFISRQYVVNIDTTIYY